MVHFEFKSSTQKSLNSIIIKTQKNNKLIIFTQTKMAKLIALLLLCSIFIATATAACTNGSDGCDTCANGNDCATCKAGYYSKVAKACSPCEVGSY